jgi:hypothetical protein
MKLLFLILVVANSAAADLSFNRDIRPILSEQCFQCHGPDSNNRKAGLRLDDEQAAKSALRSGKIGIVPGDPAQSSIYQRVTHPTKSLRMPPLASGKPGLTAEQSAKLKLWIEQGAKYERHWAFLAPRKAHAPSTPDANWPRNEIDRFAFAKMSEQGLKPSPEATKQQLLRRLSLDLSGLPPTPAEMSAFLADPSPKAYEKQVDRLLASPRYAERMAWRWLEAARYADTNGYQSDGVRDMYRWRDWVIEAFASNKPWDHFVKEQLAGDLVPAATLDQKIATAFHRNHRTSAEGGIVPEEFRVEYVADRAETTSTVFLGLTMGCARCHDHKFDPITQKDFYSLFAFFNNLPEKGLVYNWGNDEPLIKAPTREQQPQLASLDLNLKAAQKAVAAMEPSLKRARDKWVQTLDGRSTNWVPEEGLAYAKKEVSGLVEEKAGTVIYDYLTPFTFSAWINPKQDTGAILSIAEDLPEANGHGLYIIGGKLRLHVVFRWTDIGMRVETETPVALNQLQHVVATYDGSRYAKGVQLYIDGKPQKLKVLFDELNWPMNFKYPLRIGGGNGMRFDGRIEDVRVYQRELSKEEVIALNDRNPLSPQSRPEKLRLAYLDLAKPRELTQERAARQERDTYWKSLPSVMVMQEGPKRQAFLLKRGAYDAPGEAVEPMTPSALPAMPPGAPRNRLGLAEWIVSPSNPLLARVTVNRFWQMIFGIGLVKTSEDFGSQGEWPIHQDMLDWLAVDFVENGWNVKRLLRQIVSSSVYRQSSQLTPDLLQKDPENRLLARAPRLRLGPEAIRDQALFVSGLLVEKIGGPSVKPYQPAGLWQELAGGGGYQADHGEGLYRRSLYTFWKRTIAPPSMVTFDSPTRESCNVKESRTNTPLQALTLMNDTTYLEAARKLAERMLIESPQAPLQRAYQLVLARAPKPAEEKLLAESYAKFAQDFAAHPETAIKILDQGEAPLSRKLRRTDLAAWTMVASMILNLDETITRQ